jgi:ATP-dependent Clp protease ATP-binding subunit ClpA
MLNHNYIGTEHILLGLIHEGEGVAAKALTALGISLEAVRNEVEKIIGQGQQAPSGHIPFTPRAKKVLELSLREALQLGHNYIGTEHILLGLIREGEGVAAQVLVRLGADLTRVRQQVIELLHGYQGKGPGSLPAEPTGKRARARQLASAMRRMDRMDRRVTALERWVGIRPNTEDMDQQLARLEQQKQAAISAQDFEAAATLRDKQRALSELKASRERHWTRSAQQRQPLAEASDKMRDDLDQLRSELAGQRGPREPGEQAGEPEPQDGAENPEPGEPGGGPEPGGPEPGEPEASAG